MTREQFPLGSDRESVWDYPRPPRIEDTVKHIQVVFNRVVIADTHRAKRVLETSHPPTYYLPPEDIRMEYLTESARVTWCEWKGRAAYYSVAVGDRQAVHAAWCYADPKPMFRAIRNFVAFYPGPMDACMVDGERVKIQAGDFYGGWITDGLVGPFKGAPETAGW